MEKKTFKNIVCKKMCLVFYEYTRYVYLQTKNDRHTILSEKQCRLSLKIFNVVLKIKLEKKNKNIFRVNWIDAIDENGSMCVN